MKDAGTATLSLKNIGDKYHVKLTGKTKSWADNFYQVRDTLTGTIAKNGLKPEEYSKIAHEMVSIAATILSILMRAAM